MALAAWQDLLVSIVEETTPPDHPGDLHLERRGGYLLEWKRPGAG